MKRQESARDIPCNKQKCALHARQGTVITATAALPAVMLVVVVVLFELSMLGRVLLRRCFRAWIDS